MEMAETKGTVTGSCREQEKKAEERGGKGRKGKEREEKRREEKKAKCEGISKSTQKI